ncbi:hypothetical protein [Falsirhodobacter sp. alg1]|uniref:hypothetical protein n=1 Tax=Falsirhodobacter sp. alg1 TaxID=1472418 RepID=UPI0005EDBB87|nr:hypothetical protein [Falsirhodobacter sp. alg1]
MPDTRIPVALLIMRLTIAAFFAAWSSLKFYRPEWFENVFKNVYGLEFASQNMSWVVGLIQMLLVLLFVIGFLRTYTYGAIALMLCAGVVGSIPSLMEYTTYPNNLMWAGVPTLGAAISLFLLRDYDRYTVDGQRRKA